MRLIIHGEPQAKGRAKAIRVGNKSWKYDPQKREKDTLSWKIKVQANCLPLQGPVMIELNFYMKPGESLLQSQKNAKYHNFDPHIQKPDIDNLEKFFLDCANGILYTDDSQIVSLKSSKQWSEIPRTEINIMRKEDMDITEVDKKIITLFTPQELEELFQDAKILFILSENSGLDHPNCPERRIKQSASSIANFAKKYSDKLNKINRILQKDERQ